MTPKHGIIIGDAEKLKAYYTKMCGIIFEGVSLYELIQNCV